jgi:hypothetical protein
MNEPFSIVPPPELVKQWVEKWHRTLGLVECRYEYIATQAAQWGAEQELEACCEWLAKYRKPILGDDLKYVRRPKPPSLKEQALEELEQLKGDANSMGMGFDAPAIRLALEALDA